MINPYTRPGKPLQDMSIGELSRLVRLPRKLPPIVRETPPKPRRTAPQPKPARPAGGRPTLDAYLPDELNHGDERR